MRITLDDVNDKVRVELSGAAQTMLGTLYLKALDGFAKEAVSRLDYDFHEIGMTAKWAPLITVRTAQYDIWASQFLAVHPHCTVVHLGCGLDSRVFRLDPGPGVQWYDVDYPAVIALREKVYPSRDRIRRPRTAAPRRRPVPVRRTADRLLQLARDQDAEGADIDAAYRLDTVLGGQ